MERYQGVKFNYKIVAPTYEHDQRLTELNSWVHLFAQLGLAPIHSDGAYGNQSYRLEDDAFLITRSGMVPGEHLRIEDYTVVDQYDESTRTFLTRGISPPSSECFLHLYIYRQAPAIQAILHGHCELLNKYAEELDIPVTGKFHDYGTPELAESAVVTMHSADNFFILRDHGFVAIGEDIAAAGRLTLNYYGRLLQLLAAR